MRNGKNFARRIEDLEKKVSDVREIKTFCDLIKSIHGDFDGQEVRIHPAIAALFEKNHQE